MVVVANEKKVPEMLKTLFEVLLLAFFSWLECTFLLLKILSFSAAANAESLLMFIFSGGPIGMVVRGWYVVRLGITKRRCSGGGSRLSCCRAPRARVCSLQLQLPTSIAALVSLRRKCQRHCQRFFSAFYSLPWETCELETIKHDQEILDLVLLAFVLQCRKVSRWAKYW